MRPGEAAEIRQRISALQRRLRDLEQGETSVGEVAEMPPMCPMCQQTMQGAGPETSPEDMEARFERQTRRLEERVQTLERRSGWSRGASAEARSRGGGCRGLDVGLARAAPRMASGTSP